MKQTLGKVLLIDDDGISNFLTASTIHQACAAEQTAVAKNGQEAMETMAKEAFDIILLDIDMPIMDGFEFLEALKPLQGNAGFVIPIIVLLTSSVSDLDRSRAAQHPMVEGYLAKPLTTEDLRFLVALVAESKEQALQAH